MPDISCAASQLLPRSSVSSIHVTQCLAQYCSTAHDKVEACTMVVPAQYMNAPKPSGVNPICVLLVLQVMRLVRVADKKVKELSEMLQASLKAHDVERVQARIRRHNLTPTVSQTQSRAVTVLNSNDIVGMRTQ